MPMRQVDAEHSDVDWQNCIVLQTNDGANFEAPRGVVKMSNLIVDLMEGDDSDGQRVVPLPEVSAATLKAIWDYMEKYQHEKPDPIQAPIQEHLEHLIPKWDWEYVSTTLLEGGDEKKNKMLLDVLKASNFMNIMPLRDLCCAVIAHILRTKTDQEILDTFGVDGKWTAEEDEMFKQQYPWLQEREVEQPKDGEGEKKDGA
eukprot:TRINITY_DN356_c0_g2_i1.p1 TRINITY_DN356_c0_g2~~TRINITY_DN356_c0_g2_i1.p1  ORF type:complete len:201 (+),score=104.74 TRINITY_DN356_c0_g2_i1:96-698(+)